MLQEYAIDPELAADPTILRTISGFFDFSNPRRISAFPESWAKNVYSHAVTAHPKQTKHVEILLDHFRKTRCIRSFGRSYNDTTDWKKNASDQHTTKPFHAIICDGNADYIASHEIHAANPKLEAQHNWQLIKNQANLLSWLMPIFNEAKSICIIDPYFDPYKAAYKSVFSPCFKALNNRSDVTSFALGICTSDDKASLPYVAGDDAKFHADVIGKLMPSACAIKLLSALRSNMHARYLITDMASYVIDHSFDVKDTAVANVTMIPAIDADAIKKQFFPGL